MNRRLDDRVSRLEVEAIYRRISGKVAPEDQEKWDERAWETLPIGYIKIQQNEINPKRLGPEKEVKAKIERMVTVPMFRHLLMDKQCEEKLRAQRAEKDKAAQ